MKKGFTLIELMVVISIIAILSSVVLAALSATRAKSQIAAVQDDAVELRNQIELGYNGVSGTYADLVGNTPTSGASVAAATSFGASTAAIVTGLLATNNLTRVNNYAGGVVPAAAACPPVYGVTSGTPAPYESLNALTIFVDVTCTTGLAKKYAIFAAYGPTIGSSGYYCIDSSGSSLSKTTGFIPDVATPVCQ